MIFQTLKTKWGWYPVVITIPFSAQVCGVLYTKRKSQFCVTPLLKQAANSSKAKLFSSYYAALTVLYA